MASAEGVFPKIGNDPMYNSEYNLLKGITQVYVGSAFDSTISSASAGSDVGTFELDPVSAGSLISANYLDIRVLANKTVQNDDGNAGIVALEIDSKEIGGTYSNIFTEEIAKSFNNGNFQYGEISNHNYLHQLSAAELASGVQIRLSSISSVVGGDQSDATFENIQTIQELK